MKIFTVHLRRHGLNPDRDIILVREGFSWRAFFLNLFWALWHRMWLVALGLVVISIALNLMNMALGTDSTTASLLAIGSAAVMGVFANDLRRWTLARQGFAEFGVVSGKTEDDALARFLDLTPDMAKEIA